jgi:hypothetical protein
MSMSIDQLTTSIRESLKTLTADDYTEDDEKAPSIQDSYVDSIEISDRAVDLSTQADTETDFKERPDTNQEQEYEEEEDTGTDQQQGPAFTTAGSLNVLA